MVVPLLRGGSIRGVIHSSRGGLVAGAQVTVRDGDPLQLVAQSDEQGRFAIGPLSAGAVELARQSDHEPTTVLATVGSSALTVTLTALPTDTLHGRVRARPTLSRCLAPPYDARRARPAGHDHHWRRWHVRCASPARARRASTSRLPGYLTSPNSWTRRAGARLICRAKRPRVAAGITGCCRVS
jgi:hypothetical protein